jgi:hypothetical protein
MSNDVRKIMGIDLLDVESVAGIPYEDIKKTSETWWGSTFKLFDFDEVKPGVANLSSDLTINGSTVTASYVYYGGDATALGWSPQVGGETLTLQSGTVPTYNDGSPLLGTDDDSVLFNEGGYFQASSSTTGDITTEDFVFEFIYKVRNGGTAGNLRLFSKIISNAGYYCYETNAGSLAFLIDDNIAPVKFVVSANNPGTWNHVMVFCNRDEASTNGCKIYVNNILKASADFSAASATLSDTVNFTIGANTNGGSPFDSNIAYLAMWKQASWHQAGASGPAEWATIAAERFARLQGTYPQFWRKGNIPSFLDNDMEALPVDVIVDGDMEAVGTTDWGVINNATLSKESVDPYEGTQNIKILYNGTSSPGASQTPCTVGKTYRCIGKARSGNVGGEAPIIRAGGVNHWIGTTSTDWQDIDITWVQTSNTTFYLYSSCNSAGEYVEFDDIQVLEQNGDWSAGNNAVITKETSDLTNSTQCLRVAYNSVSNPFAEQDTLTIGTKYRVTGWARSGGGGNEYPIVAETSGNVIWTGTTSTSWQEIDVTFTATKSLFHLKATLANTSFEYCEFDNIVISRVDGLPTVSQRNYPAYLDKYESGVQKLYQVGANWMRVCYREDANSDLIYGYLPEPAATNNFVYSEEFDNVAWTKNQCTISPNLINAPNGELTADGIVADNATVTVASPRIAITHPASNNVISAFVKKGSLDWFELSVVGFSVSCFFDVNNGVKGTATNCDGYIEDWGNGWFRLIISYTGDGTSKTAFFFPAEGNNDKTYTGDGSTVQSYIWGAQHETTGLGYATSYIKTEASANTRVKDELQYLAGPNIGGEDRGKGTIAFNTLLSDLGGSTSSSLGRFVALTDGGAATDRIENFLSANQASVFSAATGGNSGSRTKIGDIIDGEIHSINVFYETDNLNLSVDSVKAAPDTSADMPNDIDELHVGQGYNSVNQLGLGLISDLRIYSYIRED